MGNGTNSLLHSLINTYPYIKSANIAVASGSCDTYTYKPFSKDGSNYILQEGDFLPDLDPVCSANGDPCFIPFPLTAWPAYIRGVHWYIDPNNPTGNPPYNYANYTRGSNPWALGINPNTDCWDNRSETEVTDTYAKYTDITLSWAFNDGWPHLADEPGEYPLAADDDPVTFGMGFGTTAPTPLFLYFPIGDYDAGTGATVTITSIVGNDTTPHVINLTKQDNRYQQGLIQGVTAELFSGQASSCGMPIYDNWTDFAVPFGSGYLMGFYVTLDMAGDPYYAIDYVVIDDGLEDYNVLNVGPARAYTTIQSAVNAAIDGDTIVVDPGTYYENVNFNGKRLTLTKWTGCPNPVIDGGGTAPCITLLGTEGLGTSIRGFDLTHGYGSFGGGVCANGANVQIEQCNFYANSAGMGGALYNTSGLVVDCTFKSNVGLGAGAAYVSGCSPVFEHCTFGGPATADNNHAWGGGAVTVQGATGKTTAPNFWRCYFRNNYASSAGGGAVYLLGSSSTVTVSANLTNCEFWMNRATASGGYGGALYVREYSTAKVVNCSFNSNSTVKAAGGGAAYVKGVSGGTATLSIHNSLLWGDTAAGAVSEAVAGTYSSRTLRYSIVQNETDNTTLNLYGSSTWNPYYTSTTLPDLHATNIKVGQKGADPTVTAPKTDIENNPRPLGNYLDWGCWENISQ